MTSSFTVLVGGGAVLSAPWFSSSSSSSTFSKRFVRLSTRATTTRFERGRKKRGRLNKIRLVADSKKNDDGEEDKEYEARDTHNATVSCDEE